MKLDTLTTRAIQGCLLLMALAAPMSIAATQAAWAFALLFWLVRAVAVRPRPRFSPLGLAILAFVGLSLVSSFLSYEPGVSLKKMVSVSLVTIVCLFAGYAVDGRMLNKAVVLLLAGCFAASLFSFVTLAAGKNLKLLQLSDDSPLRAAGIQENDTILKAGDRAVSSPEDIAAAIADSPGNAVPVHGYRHEIVYTANIVFSSPEASSLGIIAWSRGRDTRASGFYGMYVTFAEVLQLIASLALGLLLAADGRIFRGKRLMLLIALAFYGGALFLTITRASWLSFVISASVMLVLVAGRRTQLVLAAAAVPLVMGALVYLQRKRQVGFFDASDDSIAWRLTVWREAFNVLISSPRHLAVGIGMDSIKRHWQDWHMFDNGMRPLGHTHSTPLQIAFERGVPALAAWVVWMGLYIRSLLRAVRAKDVGWVDRGVLLGAVGGTIGFLTSSLVHYNWGDSEVAMVFYIIMGMSLAVIARVRGAVA